MYKDDALVLRGLVVLALVWGAVYLGWRAVDTWHGTQPVLFVVLWACELFGWTMLASFCLPGVADPGLRRPPVD